MYCKMLWVAIILTRSCENQTVEVVRKSITDSLTGKWQVCPDHKILLDRWLRKL